MDLDSIAHPEGLGLRVARVLREQIISGALPSGTHLVEARLSATLDVSRGPIRDALRQLHTEGLVESRRRGTFVIGLSEEDVDELYSLRSLIEAEAWRRALGGPQETWTALEGAVQEMTEAQSAAHVDRFAEADLAFHSAIFRASGHRRLADVWAQYMPTFAALMATTNAHDAPDLGPALVHHLELLETAKKGDVEGTLRIVTEHLKASRDRMKRVQIEHRKPDREHVLR